MTRGFTEEITKTYTYPFVEDHGGKEFSRRPRQSNDCTVIALAIVTGWEYDRAYDLLKAAGRKSGQGFHLGQLLRRVMLAGRLGQSAKGFEGWFVTIHTFNAIKGQPRMRPGTFISQYPYGRFILRTAGHVFAVVDGVARGAWQEHDARCVYSAYEFRGGDNGKTS